MIKKIEIIYIILTLIFNFVIIGTIFRLILLYTLDRRERVVGKKQMITKNTIRTFKYSTI